MHKTDSLSNNPIIFFDGVCNLCNSSIQFVIKKDKTENFLFSPLQSEFAKGKLQGYNINAAALDTVILLFQNKAYQKLDAIIKIGQLLGFPYNVAVIFKIFPQFLKNYIYYTVAKNRYYWFGEEESCMVPNPQLKSRFL